MPSEPFPYDQLPVGGATFVHTPMPVGGFAQAGFCNSTLRHPEFWGRVSSAATLSLVIGLTAVFHG